MNDVKWIKISTAVFNDECFQIIDDIPEADAIELIWFKLLVFAGKQNNNGLFIFKNEIAYTDEMLASIFHRPLNTVRLAMTTFVQLKMIEQIDGVYSIPNWDKYQNLDAYENKKLRDKEYSKKYREKQKNILLEMKEKPQSSEKSSDASSDVSRFCSYSYSYSNNTNINNLLHILDTYKSKYIDIDIKLVEVLKEWMEYKDNKKPKSKNHYDTELGVTKLIAQFINVEKEHGVEAVKGCVDYSISNNYQGVVWDKATEFRKEPEILIDMNYWYGIFNAYKRQDHAASARKEFEKRVSEGFLLEDQMAIAKDIYKAILLYIENYQKKNPDDTNFTKVPALDKWFVEDCDYWLREHRKMRRSN